MVIKRVCSPRDRTTSRLDAEVRVGADAGTGETVVLRLYGEVADHADSVVLPLLLPDAPVVVWWPVSAPLDPANDPLGKLAQRRVTDTYAAEAPVRELNARADAYSPGDTDLSWTRITPWRSMLAAALDQVVCDVKAVEVEGEEFNPSVELLAMWLADRLDVPVKRSKSSGRRPHRRPHGNELRPDRPAPRRRHPGDPLHRRPARPCGGAQAPRHLGADRGGAAPARPGRHLRVGAAVRGGPAERGDGRGRGGRPRRRRPSDRRRQGAGGEGPAKAAAKAPAKKAASE